MQTEYTKVCRDITGARVVAGALLQGGDGISGHADAPGTAKSWIHTGVLLGPADFGHGCVVVNACWCIADRDWSG